MDTYRIILTPKSSFSTPLHSDTLFGHICWAIKYLYEEKRLIDFLKEYLTPSPPLLISSGIPVNMVPVPRIGFLNGREKEDFVEQKFGDKKICGSFYLKQLRRKQFINLDGFNHIKDSLTPETLSDLIYEEMSEKKDQEICEAVVFHNTVNRITGTVTEGLFNEKETFYSDTDGDNRFNIFIRTILDRKMIESIFKYIGTIGFGRNKFTGKGQFDFKIDDSELPEIQGASNPNAFITLSLYIPTSEEKFEKCFYDILTKYPKLGGDYAKSAINSQKNFVPFKMPLVMFREGSLFVGYDSNKLYGQLKDGIHKIDKDIKQYGYAYPVGVNYTGE
jgi:CRISPR-associated protein Csm4